MSRAFATDLQTALPFVCLSVLLCIINLYIARSMGTYNGRVIKGSVAL